MNAAVAALPVLCVGWRCRAVALTVAALAGALFGVGLLISGMTDPARVIAFLNPLGGWDPSLSFVLLTAIPVYALALHQIRRHRAQPLLEAQFHLPTRRDIEPRLVIGAALFGVGWGLGGLCPGPAIVASAGGAGGALLFALAMFAGMYAHFRFVAGR